MTVLSGPLDQAIRETVHRSGGVDLSGDPRESLSLLAAPITTLFDLSDEGMALLNPEATVERQVEAWLDAGCVADARRLLAHALPPRHALWWALLCLTEAHHRNPYPDTVASAFATVLDFVLGPTDAGRRACLEASNQAGSTTAGGVVASAAFLSGGSMAPADCPPVLPEAHLCGRMCGVAVYLASVRFNPAKYKAHLAHFIAVGLGVARGEVEIPETPAETAAEAPAPVAVAEVEKVAVPAEKGGTWAS